LSPDTDTLLGNWPGAGRARIWVRGGESSIMSEHQILQLDELGEEIHLFGFAVDVTDTMIEVIGVYNNSISIYSSI
jgi:hypothetical protein